jgi:hypothetical protein
VARHGRGSQRLTSKAGGGRPSSGSAGASCGLSDITRPGGISACMHREGGPRQRRSPAGQPNPAGKLSARASARQQRLNLAFQFLESPRALGLTRLGLTRRVSSDVHSESIGLARHGPPRIDHEARRLCDHCADSQNPFRHSPEHCAPFAMTSPMYASTGPDIKVVSAILPLASCGFAAHASIARVCGAPRGRSGSSRASDTGLRGGLAPQDYLGAMSYLACFVRVRRS